jgi:2-hydroxy-6-oxonona-2,4-dienedioate hydrolase
MSYRSIWQDLVGVSFRQRWVDAGGISTRVLETDADLKAPLLILLHGTGGHAEAYVRNLGAHGNRFRVVAMDMLGHGWTDKPIGPMEIANYGNHVLAVLDAYEAARAHISGESLGGWVAAWIAINHPGRVHRLVLNTTGGSVANPAVMARIKDLTSRAADDPNWDFIRSRLEWLMHDTSHVNDDLIATRQRIYASPGASEAMRKALVLQDMDVRVRNMLNDDDWSSIGAETLVLWTTHDPTNPVSEAERLADLIPGAKLVVMQDCGHWPQFEDPDTFNAVHARFLSGEPIDEWLHIREDAR